MVRPSHTVLRAYPPIFLRWLLQNRHSQLLRLKHDFSHFAEAVFPLAVKVGYNQE